jgi:hypothetical protein
MITALIPRRPTYKDVCCTSLAIFFRFHFAVKQCKYRGYFPWLRRRSSLLLQSKQTSNLLKDINNTRATKSRKNWQIECICKLFVTWFGMLSKEWHLCLWMLPCNIC